MARLRARLHPAARRRLIRFAAVGISGIGVNLLVTWAARHLWFGEDPGRVALNLAATAGTVVSIFTNFLLNDLWTWGDRAKGGLRAWLRRLGRYYVTALVGFGLELVGFNAALHALGDDLYLLAKLAGIALATISNFVLMHYWAFREEPTRSRA